MKKNKLNLIFLIILLPLLTFCGGVKDALEGKKRSEQSDEFLVKKKNPLQTPPDMDKLPLPGEDFESNYTKKDDDVKELLEIKETNKKENSPSDSGLLDNMKKKIQ